MNKKIAIISIIFIFIVTAVVFAAFWRKKTGAPDSVEGTSLNNDLKPKVKSISPNEIDVSSLDSELNSLDVNEFNENSLSNQNLGI